MYCVNCRRLSLENAKVCPFCGAQFSTDTTQPLQPSADVATDLYHPAKLLSPIGSTDSINQTNQTKQSPKPKRKSKKATIVLIISLVALIVAIAAAIVVIAGYNLNKQANYAAAVDSFGSNDYEQAYSAFSDLGDYKDAATQADLSKQWMNYQAAQALYTAKDYDGAKQAFENMGDFEDSARMVILCKQHIDYAQAQDNFEAGEYELALDIFMILSQQGFEDSSIWENKTRYAMADELMQTGDFYGAYKTFKELGDYQDSAKRMQQCTTTLPATSMLHFDPAYTSAVSQLIVDASSAKSNGYFKLYSGENLVARFWINVGETLTIDLAPGDYQIHQAIGEVWFGEEVMFGDEGAYVKMTFEGNLDYFNLGSNVRMTLLLETEEGSGNVRSENVGRQEF